MEPGGTVPAQVSAYSKAWKTRTKLNYSARQGRRGKFCEMLLGEITLWVVCHLAVTFSMPLPARRYSIKQCRASEEATSERHLLSTLLLGETRRSPLRRLPPAEKKINLHITTKYVLGGWRKLKDLNPPNSTKRFAADSQTGAAEGSRFASWTRSSSW